MPESTALKTSIRETLFSVLSLDLEPEQIGFDEPLFEGQLGLDSVDMFSVIIAIEKKYAFEMDDDADFLGSFRTISAIAETVVLHRPCIGPA